MNEEPPTPFDTVGDEPIEARVVAWVLGEASAFEAAELERLCEERPELLVFRRRMLALHGLLAEAEASESDHSWKLPAEKRKALDEILGGGKVVQLDSHQELRVRHAGRRAFLAIAACVVLAVVVLQLVHPVWITRQVREPEKRVDFMPPGSGAGAELTLQQLNRAVRDQEDIVESSRKTLATIARTKEIIIKSQESAGVDEGREARDVSAVAKNDKLEDSIKRGLDHQDFAEAKSKFESDQQLLQQLKLKLIEQTIASKASEEALARNDGKPHPSKPAAPAPTAAPAGRPDGTYKVDSAAMTASREPGLQQAARQNQLAKQAKPRVVPEAPSSPAEPAVAATKPMPSIEAKGYASGLEGRSGNGLELKGEIAQSPQTESEKRLETGTPASVASRRGRVVASGAFTSRSMSGSGAGESLDESLAVTGKGQIETGEGLTNGLRTGDQAIERSSIDEVLNKPKSEPEAGRKAKGNEEFAAKPPVLAGKDSGGMHEQVAMEKTPAVLGAKLKLGGTSTYTGGTTIAGGDLKLDGAVESNFGQAGSIDSDKNQTLGRVAGNKENADAPIRSNPALTDEHVQNVDKVRQSLYLAEGNLNLGKYNDSKKAYEDVLRVDPYNSAARRGLEKIASAKSDYYRAAYDHTRAELLAEVDKAWELEVPADGKDQNFAGFINYGSPITDPFAESDSSEIGKPITGTVFPVLPAQLRLVDLMEEIPASENPYSTFSLNISDASFQLAKASLAKGERPDPASIKTEQFYNAVDYGDPAPASNEPVAATIEQSAHPVIPGRNLVRVALRTGSEGRSAAQPLRLTLLVDQSGSMVREDRRASMEHALAQLGVLLTKNDLVTVVGFSRTSRLLADGMTGDQAAKLGELVNQTASEGGTNLEEAMKLGGQMAERHQLAGAQNRMVLFTDGAANLGDANPARLAEQVKSLRQKGIAFDIAGIGADGLNDRLLSELARNGNGRYYVVGDEKSDSFARQLAGAFRPAAENVKVQVNFNPQRVGKYKLIGFEKDRLKTEDFRNDAVDAAELAAEEAGVAIYQIEPLAEGTGELGEVSVRFRDAASKEMVERSWTISYDSQAAAFDRATPSMQLAGLSLLAAEKLKGGALADAIDFKQLSGPSAFVKQFYGDSPRVGDMLQVIEKIK